MANNDFEPTKTPELNSWGVNTLYDMLNNKDSNWFKQSTGSMCRWGCASANGYFYAVAEASQNKDGADELNLFAVSLAKIGKAVAECMTKDYDAVYHCQIEKERTVTVEVQKTRKIGLFKKETYIDHEAKTENYSEPNDFYGWRIERLSKQEVEVAFRSQGGTTLNVDYCLGSDGNLYFVLPGQNPEIYRCVDFSPMWISNTFYNVYTAAMGGVVGALDAIPINPEDQSRKVDILMDGMEYRCNFPVQIDDPTTYPYDLFEGALRRIIGLLDESEWKACIKKNGWITSLLETNYGIKC